jgi:hypothetical protein
MTVELCQKIEKAAGQQDDMPGRRSIPEEI